MIQTLSTSFKHRTYFHFIRLKKHIFSNMETCVPFLYNSTNNNNTTVVKHQLVVYEMVMIGIFSAFLITTNLALVIGLKKTNKQLTTSQKLYIYLSLNDSIVGFVSLPYMFIVYYLSIDYCVLLSTNKAIMMYTFDLSLGTFAVISILRNVVISKPSLDQSHLRRCSGMELRIFNGGFIVFLCIPS